MVAPALSPLPESHHGLQPRRAGMGAAGSADCAGDRAGRGPARRLLTGVERALQAVFGAGADPMRQLGALGFFLFWLVAVTGIYLYVYFDPTTAGAYESMERLAREQPYAGGLLRSLHRYGADALVAVVLLHLARELLLGRFRGFRWFTWVSGVPLLWLLVASGVVGYWLGWGRLGQFAGNASAEWLDALPLFGASLARVAASPEALGERLFTLLVFMHIGIPLALLAGMYLHIQRLAHAHVYPARTLALGVTATLVALSLARPVTGQGPADFGAAPGELALDWFYLFVFPLADAFGAAGAWALAACVTLVLLALPLLPGPPAAAPARVDAANCNGCARCLADCPYEALAMRPVAGRQTAVVLASACAGCGICAGACPSASPFRRAAVLRSGIELPQRPLENLRRALDEALEARSDAPLLLVFGCEHGARLTSAAGPGAAVFGLECVAALPPAFVEYALRRGAGGVLIAGCGPGECVYRLGERWSRERLERRREPALRPGVPEGRVRAVCAGAGEEALLQREISNFRASVALSVAAARAPRTEPQPLHT